MRAGRLRTRINFERPVDTADGLGGVSRTWEPVLSRRADLLSSAGVAVEELSQRYSGMTHAWTLRPVEIDTTWRAVIDGAPHRIVAVLTDRVNQIRLLTESSTPEASTYGQ